MQRRCQNLFGKGSKTPVQMSACYLPSEPFDEVAPELSSMKLCIRLGETYPEAVCPLAAAVCERLVATVNLTMPTEYTAAEEAMQLEGAANA